MNRGRRRGGATLSAALLRLHRSGNTNLLLIGGTRRRRESAARVFHDNSLVRGRPLVVLDCARREGDLRQALEAWLAISCASRAAFNPLRECDQGTLFLDPVGRLSPPTQRLLLVLARRIGRDDPADAIEAGPYRLAAGDGYELLDAVARHEFCSALFDALDKVRGELGGLVRRGAA
jgi:DNA-binding NtrC family response regulator